MTAGSTVTSTTIITTTLSATTARYYSAPPVIYERPIVYREAPMYYAPMGPPSLNIIVPLR